MGLFFGRAALDCRLFIIFVFSPNRVLIQRSVSGRFSLYAFRQLRMVYQPRGVDKCSHARASPAYLHGAARQGREEPKSSMGLMPVCVGPFGWATGICLFCSLARRQLLRMSQLGTEAFLESSCTCGHRVRPRLL